MFRSLPKPLSELVDAKFQSAKASDSLSFASSSLAILHTDSGLPFQLRFCPSLAKKPLPNKDVDTKPKKKVNPFENPDPALFITDVPPVSSLPTHFLVLNKFPIIPSHFILATKINKAQTAVLEEEDLGVAYECLRAWEDEKGGRRLYGFFNSGEHSGASQAHRHLQFVPVEGMKSDDESGEWELLMDKIVESGAKMPFEVYWRPISPSTSVEQLYDIYTELYDSAYEGVKSFVRQSSEDWVLHDTSDGSSPFSYNLGMTTTALMLVPRRKEGSTLRGNVGSDIGFAAFNGTVLAGTMMVKSPAEWNLLRGNNIALKELLEEIGIPRSSKDASTKI